MPATPLRIAQTSSELKKQRKQNGLQIPARQQKQLERAYELDQRAARFRDAEERRRAAKKKREEKEAKEERARQQIGVGLATQLAGYSHTQVQLKSGMEAFLGVNKRKEEAQRNKTMALLGKIDVISEAVNKEPWDDDDEDEDDIVEAISQAAAPCEKSSIDYGLDDDSLLEADKLAVPEPKDASAAVKVPAAVEQTPAAGSAAFDQFHGPVNKIIESVLETLPEPLIELLSQDISTKLPGWDPTPSILHKLNPVGMPPHRLRIKLGCVVTLLRDLNTSTPLSKSQHLRILRAENERLECLVLDGQLEGTKILLTRVPFQAKYKNDEQFPFQRLQYPVRIATNYSLSGSTRPMPQSGFKLPSIVGHARPSSTTRRTKPLAAKPLLPTNSNPAFKLPGLPASKTVPAMRTASSNNKHTTLIKSDPIPDCWDDFLESGTQIARELSNDIAPTATNGLTRSMAHSPSINHTLPPLSTQDLDFSLDDLDDVSPINPAGPKPSLGPARDITTPVPSVSEPASTNTSAAPSPLAKTVAPALPAKASPKQASTTVPDARPQSNSMPENQRTILMRNSDIISDQRKPPSVSDRPGLKRKTWTAPKANRAPDLKRKCLQPSFANPPATGVNKTVTHDSLDDFILSSQDVVSFFDDDENMTFGSPPIAA